MRMGMGMGMGLTARSGGAFVRLMALSLSATQVEEDAAATTLVGNIVGLTDGSTVELADDAGGRFMVSGTTVRVADDDVFDYIATSTHNITLRETHPDAGNSPRDTVIAITVLSPFSAEADALFARMTSQPDRTRKDLIDSTIVALKSAGVWSRMVALYVLGAHDSQAARLNWVSTSYDLSPVNAPTFTVDRGFTGNGLDARLQAAGFPFQDAMLGQNDAHHSVWSRTDNTGAYVMLGDDHLGVNYIIPRRLTSTMRSKCMCASSQDFTSGISTGVGHTLVTRTESTTTTCYKNGSSVGTNAVASSPVTGSSAQLALLASATGTAGTPGQCLHATLGRSLDATQAGALHTILNDWKTTVGA